MLNNNKKLKENDKKLSDNNNKDEENEKKSAINISELSAQEINILSYNFILSLDLFYTKIPALASMKLL